MILQGINSFSFGVRKNLTKHSQRHCGEFKNGENCLVEMLHTMDGEYAHEKGIVRAGIEVKRFESEEACALRESGDGT